MKIAMIGHKRIPSREGGVEQAVEALAVRMAAAGHRVYAYNRRAGHKKKRKSYKGVHLITVPTIEKKSLNAIIYTFFATVHALFCHYDVIHFHAEGPCAFLWMPKLFGIRTVVTIHGLDWQRAKWGGFATRFLKYAEKTAAKYADEIIVLSPQVSEYFDKTYHRKTVCIPNGVDAAQLMPPKLITQKYGLQAKDYLLFLARIVPEKGLHYLLEAYKKADCPYKLVIAGGSSHTDDYYEQIRRSCEGDPNIIMTGFVQGRELEELFGNCYLYILPSDIEGMPISLLEAMSYGAQCLVSDIPENVNVTGEYAATFSKGNVVDLADKLAALTKPEHSFSHASAEIAAYVTNKYRWEKVVEQTMQLYGREHENTDR